MARESLQVGNTRRCVWGGNQAAAAAAAGGQWLAPQVPLPNLSGAVEFLIASKAAAVRGGGGGPGAPASGDAQGLPAALRCYRQCMLTRSKKANAVNDAPCR